MIIEIVKERSKFQEERSIYVPMNEELDQEREWYRSFEGLGNYGVGWDCTTLQIYALVSRRWTTLHKTSKRVKISFNTKHTKYRSCFPILRYAKYDHYRSSYCWNRLDVIEFGRIRSCKDMASTSTLSFINYPHLSDYSLYSITSIIPFIMITSIYTCICPCK